MKRIDGRQANELRPIRITRGFQKHPAGSVLMEWGDNKVLCSATVEERLPPWMNPNEGKGWITAEYMMLPASSDQRIQRKRALENGRTHEIQRLIGRAIRAAIPLKDLGPRTIHLDCDVLQADGGTRVASITGSYLALALAIDHLIRFGKITQSPRLTPIAAVSVGRCSGQILADLNYAEDSKAEVDANVVMNSRGEFIELQGTAEDGAFTKSEWDELLKIAGSACEQIFEIQKRYLSEWNLHQ